MTWMICLDEDEMFLGFWWWMKIELLMMTMVDGGCKEWERKWE